VAANRKYPIEPRECAVRLYRESDRKVIAQLARHLDVRPGTLRNWIRQDEADLGKRDDRPPTGSNLPERREEMRNPGLPKVAIFGVRSMDQLPNAE
jgi:transposase